MKKTDEEHSGDIVSRYLLCATQGEQTKPNQTDSEKLGNSRQEAAHIKACQNLDPVNCHS